jgi:hypothetical protein
MRLDASVYLIQSSLLTVASVRYAPVTVMGGTTHVIGI